VTYSKDHLQTVEHLNVLRQTFISPSDQIILTAERERERERDREREIDNGVNNKHLLESEFKRVSVSDAPDVGLFVGVIQRHEEL